eukprot:CAMPEP_0197863568 /NCGR_PEP_ID=MMETSP1438-20131217/41096_1 /TAXON_ID=1461541 /ORGANISM="Pterosperma sp., Strain CCMP1384" /LENGTH=582 /DNA_ID=CAMNT_0043481515 /DNA_START=119 /DNA_END=1864 /DNA_ORIENTATION=-
MGGGGNNDDNRSTSIRGSYFQRLWSAKGPRPSAQMGSETGRRPATAHPSRHIPYIDPADPDSAQALFASEHNYMRPAFTSPSPASVSGVSRPFRELPATHEGPPGHRQERPKPFKKQMRPRTAPSNRNSSPNSKNTRPGTARSSSTAPGTGTGTGTIQKEVVVEEDDPTCASYEFFLTGLNGNEVQDNALLYKEDRHCDYVFTEPCIWDRNEDDLDTSELNPSMQYNRMYYSWSMDRRPASSMANMEKTTWDKIKHSKTVALEDLTNWVDRLRPRSVHDFKPLFVLVKGVMRVVLERELDFFSEELINLRQRLKLQEEENELLRDDNEKLRNKVKELNLDLLAGSVGQNMSSKAHKRKTAMEMANSLQNQRRALEAAKEQELKDSLRLQQEALEQLILEKDKQIEDQKLQLYKWKKNTELAEKHKKSLADQLRDLVEFKMKEEERRKREEEWRKANQVGEGLKMLFQDVVPVGCWQFVSDLTELRNFFQLVLDHVGAKYNTHCQLTMVAYSEELDLDGEDDLETYDDNVMEVLATTLTTGTFKPGDIILLPHQASHVFEAANKRRLIEIDHVPDEVSPVNSP